MTGQHVYQIHIRAEVEEVWRALTDPEATRQYFHATAWASPPVAGEPFHTVLPDGSVAVDGIVEEVTPPSRLVHTWHPVYDTDLAAEPPSRVTWELTRAGEGLTHLRLTHSALEQSPLTSDNVEDGWVWILDSLKTLLETGAPLPARAREPEAAGGARAAGGAQARPTGWPRRDRHGLAPRPARAGRIDPWRTGPHVPTLGSGPTARGSSGPPVEQR